jgi:UDP-N-acetylglucosamine 1-carboxyvinyltransferase
MSIHSHIVIHQSGPLEGKVRVAGAKNAALKILAGCLLTTKPCVIGNLPHLNDITFMLELLVSLGCELTVLDQYTIRIDPSHLNNLTVPYELVKKMRASIVVLGPILAAYGRANVALPGGCMIGSRPVDIHIEGLRAMGAEIDLVDGYIKASVKGRLKGSEIHMHTVTVTGTENLMMAATLADGITNLYNAACEPEVVDLANFLKQLGAKISGAGTPHITIEGVNSLQGACYQVIADRIEAGTYLIGAAITHGIVSVYPVVPTIISNTLQILSSAGAKITESEQVVTVDMRGRELKSVSIETAPYPGFATDMQAQVIAMNAVASGVAEVKETIFENRFMHVAELQRMGANIRVNGSTATVIGVNELVGVPVMARDLRAAASLVLAGLVASGKTIVEGVHHLDRGYEYLEEKFAGLGAKIDRRVTS